MKSKKAENDFEVRRPSNDSTTDGDSLVVHHLRHRGPLAAAWALFEDFSGNSTVHGVKYLGEKKRHWIERLFWVVAFFISLFGCSLLIYKLYVKWLQYPVIVSFAEESTPVWQIPFPAITICPETKNKMERFDFANVFNNILNDTKENVTADDLMALEAMAQICDSTIFRDLPPMNSGLAPTDIVKQLKSLRTPINETATLCRWKRIAEDCRNYFTEILTEEGYCFTFNILDFNEMYNEDRISPDFTYVNHNNISTQYWTLDEGYKTPEIPVFPKRSFVTGFKGGINLFLNLDKNDFEYICRGPIQGFKILFHTPAEIPRVSRQFFRVPIGQEVTATVKPSLTTTSDGLANYEPRDRQCYFNKDRNLEFFKFYTQSNCETECLAKYTLANCKCVKFSMPRDKDTKICTQVDMNCYIEAERSFILEEVNRTANSALNKHEKTNCNCLPSCTSIIYDAEISTVEVNFDEVFKGFGVEKKHTEQSADIVLTHLFIFFKEKEFVSSKRSEIYGWTDFIANCGGLLGLFMGVSLLSLIEILYYVTLRVACIQIKARKTRKVADEDPVTGINIGFKSQDGEGRQ